MYKKRKDTIPKLPFDLESIMVSHNGLSYIIRAEDS